MTESSLKCMVLIIFAEGGKLAMVHKICWQEISLWKGRIRNEQPIWPSFPYLGANFISRLCLTCIMLKSSVMPSVNAPITIRRWRFWIKHSPGTRTVASWSFTRTRADNVKTPDIKKAAGKSIQQSMPRKGNGLGNAVMENFFGLLKSKVLYLRVLHLLDEFCQKLTSYFKYYTKNWLCKFCPVQNSKRLCITFVQLWKGISTAPLPLLGALPVLYCWNGGNRTSLLPPQINFALFLPQMEFTQNLGLTLIGIKNF